MSDKIIQQGQSFFDKVIENTGSIENAFEMALLNGTSITGDVTIGQELQVSGITSKSIASIFNKNKRPATAMTAEEILSIQRKGIGKVRIGSTFIVG